MFLIIRVGRVGLTMSASSRSDRCRKRRLTNRFLTTAAILNRSQPAHPDTMENTVRTAFRTWMRHTALVLRYFQAKSLKINTFNNMTALSTKARIRRCEMRSAIRDLA